MTLSNVLRDRCQLLKVALVALELIKVGLIT